MQICVVMYLEVQDTEDRWIVTRVFCTSISESAMSPNPRLINLQQNHLHPVS